MKKFFKISRQLLSFYLFILKELVSLNPIFLLLITRKTTNFLMENFFSAKLNTKMHLGPMEYFDQISAAPFPNVQRVTFAAASAHIVPVTGRTYAFPKGLDGVRFFG